MNTAPTIRNPFCRYLMIALITISIALFSCFDGSARANVCPFCSSVAQTFTDQLAGQDVVVAAELLEVPELPDDPGADLPRATFKITTVLKGKRILNAGMEFKALLVGRYKPGKEFLVMGTDPPAIVWTTPIVASKRLLKYLTDIQTLPESGPDRLEFFQDYFEDDVSSIAFDAYDEFAKAPYDDLIALKDRMNRQQLLDWVLDPELAINRRRLYFTMLGICGGDAEAVKIEKLIREGGSTNLRGLDALVACYLCLKGEAGVDLIEEEFLRNDKAEFTDTMGAVSALRFHATEVEIVDRKKIIVAIRALLDRPKMADLIIPDLARWEDWSVMEKVVTMFKESDDDKRWLRVPIVSYLIACPLPQAKVYLAELKKLDPAAVERANLFGQGYDDDEDDDDEGEIQPAIKDEIAEPESKDAAVEQGVDATAKSEMVTVPVVTYKIPIEDVVVSADTATDELSEASISGGNSDAVDLLDDERVQAEDERVQSDDERVQAEDERVQAEDERVQAEDEPSVAQVAGPESIGQLPVAVVPYLELKIIFIPLIVSILLFVLLWSVVSGSFQRLIF